MYEELHFCEFRAGELDRLSQLLLEIFETTPQDIETIYDVLRTSFHERHFPDRNDYSIDYRGVDGSPYSSAYKTATVKGSDLPVTFGDPNADKTISIVAQDSRRPEDWQVERLLMGIPFGLDIDFLLANKDQSPYYVWHWICKLAVPHGYRVHLTDFWKIWIPKVHPKKPERELFVDILKRELEIFRPSVVASIGNPARYAVDRCQANLEAQDHWSFTKIAFPHFSGAANGTWSKTYGSASAENKLKVLAEVMGSIGED